MSQYFGCTIVLLAVAAKTVSSFEAILAPTDMSVKAGRTNRPNVGSTSVLTG
jgi:hypothetical protein